MTLYHAGITPKSMYDIGKALSAALTAEGRTALAGDQIATALRFISRLCDPSSAAADPDATDPFADVDAAIRAIRENAGLPRPQDLGVLVMTRPQAAELYRQIKAVQDERDRLRSERDRLRPLAEELRLVAVDMENGDLVDPYTGREGVKDKARELLDKIGKAI